jgi:hypothetical protein
MYKEKSKKQEKMQIFSSIKQRILHYIDNKNISRRQFYEITGISRGTLESGTGITEDTLMKFLKVYTVDLNWLILNNEQNTNIVNEPAAVYGRNFDELIKDIEILKLKIKIIEKKLNL